MTNTQTLTATEIQPGMEAITRNGRTAWVLRVNRSHTRTPLVSRQADALSLRSDESREGTTERIARAAELQRRAAR